MIVTCWAGALAFFALQSLPINYAGLLLILFGVVLFVAEIKIVSHGILAIGGIVAMALGSLMLFDRSEPAFRLSLGLIIPGTVVTGLFFLFVIGAGLRAQALPVKVGKEILLGKVVPAYTAIDAAGGKVFVEGEYWSAVSDAPIEAGRPVEILGSAGLTLKVKPQT